MAEPLLIRPYEAADQAAVRSLFITVNRLLAPEGMAGVFETYIENSLRQEIDRIEDYYASRNGTFWVATQNQALVGMAGIEEVGDKEMELRRMYVDPTLRRQGIARQFLDFVEAYCTENGVKKLHLSTSEIQDAALSFYRNSGYQLVREEVSKTASNKTIGGGIKRYYFVKRLKPGS